MSTNLDLEYFRDLLLAKRKLLDSLEQIDNNSSATVELDQSRVGRLSRMDALQGQAMSLETERRRRLELQKIDAALERVDSGNYGFCLRCEEQIRPARLEVDPAATLCIQCADKIER